MDLSITLDNSVGGIANSLVTYSKALKKHNQNHTIILPRNAPIISSLQNFTNVLIITYPKIILKFHIISRFIFCPGVRTKLKNSRIIYIHNSMLIKHLKQYSPKTAFINHSGKVRKLKHSGMNIFLTARALQQFEDTFPYCYSKNFVINHGFENMVEANNVSERCEGVSLKVVAAGRFAGNKGFADLIQAAKIIQDKNLNIHITLFASTIFSKP